MEKEYQSLYVEESCLVGTVERPGTSPQSVQQTRNTEGEWQMVGKEDRKYAASLFLINSGKKRIIFICRKTKRGDTTFNPQRGGGEKL